MPFDGTRYQASAQALDEIDAIIDLLGTEDRWCKDSVCSSDGRRCILGAVLLVHRGRASLTEPILAAIRQVTGQPYRRIEAFNDDPATTHPLVLEVLRHARGIVGRA